MASLSPGPYNNIGLSRDPFTLSRSCVPTANDLTLAGEFMANCRSPVEKDDFSKGHPRCFCDKYVKDASMPPKKLL